MLSKLSLATFMVFLSLCGPSDAQVRAQDQRSAKALSPSVTRSAAQPAGARLVRPDESVTGAKSSPARIRPDAVTIGRDQSREQIFKHNRLSQDPLTVDTVRRMNPSVNLDRLDAHAGQPLYVPRVAESPRREGAVLQPRSSDAVLQPRKSDTVLQMRDPNFARVQLAQDRKDLAALQKQTSVGKDALFASPKVATRHQTVLKDATLASQRLEAFTPAMSPRDVALLNAQFGTVHRVANPAVAMSTVGKSDGALPQSAGQPLTAERITALESSAQPLQSVLRVTSRSGASYEDLRREVKVMVSHAEPTRPPRAWRVYVLPAAMVDRPDDYPDDTLLSLLRGLTFTALTTPASERFVFSDLAVWLGPEDAYAAALADVRARRVNSRPVPIRDTSPPVIEVKFVER